MFYQLHIANKMEHFSYKSECAMEVQGWRKQISSGQAKKSIGLAYSSSKYM